MATNSSAGIRARVLFEFFTLLAVFALGWMARNYHHVFIQFEVSYWMMLAFFVSLARAVCRRWHSPYVSALSRVLIN